MANSFKGLLPNGQLPSRAEAQVRDLISTEAPPPDLSAYSTTAEVGEMVDDKIESATAAEDGMIPIFATFAQAAAWEVANPGLQALTIEPPRDPSAWRPAPPVFDSSGRTYTIPSDEGATYTVDGVTTSAGVYSVGLAATSITVEANPKSGYDFEGTASWFFAWSVGSLRTYEEAVLADAPLHFVPLDDAVGSATARNLGTDGRGWAAANVEFGAAGVGNLASSATFARGAIARSSSSVASPDPNLLVGAASWTAEAIYARMQGSGRMNLIGKSRDSWALRMSTNNAYPYHNSTLAYGAPAVLVGEVAHLAAVYDGENLTIYKNGEVFDSVAASGAVAAGQGFAAIGYTASEPDGIEGRLAGVAVYNKALAGPRIQEHAASAGLA